MTVAALLSVMQLLDLSYSIVAWTGLSEDNGMAEPANGMYVCNLGAGVAVET